jgi:cyclopropane fatty-acyl-phospholipid synthase-like methyltransferase
MESDQLSTLQRMYSRYHYGSPTGVSIELSRLLRQRTILQLEAQDFQSFDQEHFLGLEPVDAAIDLLRIQPGGRILDIGSGLGGPARYIARMTGASIDAVEVQEARALLSRHLTALSCLSERVATINQDFCEMAESVVQYDGAISLLAMLHFLDRSRAHRQACRFMKVGARLLIEDYVVRRPITLREKDFLLGAISFPSPMNLREYCDSLSAAGLKVLSVTDMTTDWHRQVKMRAEGFLKVQSKLLGDYTESQLADLLSFFVDVAEIFDMGIVGGVRILAERQSPT